jgi:glutaredoxin 2
MEALLSNISVNQEKDIHHDIRLLETMANVFLNTYDTDNAVMFRHFGNELQQFSSILQNKLVDVTQKLQKIEHTLNNAAHKDAIIVTNLISTLTPKTDIETNRAEVMLHKEHFGFIPISSHDLNERINIKNEMLSPVICLWEESLHKSKGKVQSALRYFVNTIETKKGEFTDTLMDISSNIKQFDHLKSTENLKVLGQWKSKLSEIDTDNLKAAESAIALASYILGDNHVYTQPEIVNEIQKRHTKYLESL